MKKKIFSGLLVAALVVTQAISAFAAPSKSAGISLVGDSAGNYTVSSDFSAAGETVANLIEEINAGGATIQNIAEQAPELASALEEKSLMGSFVDITAAGATKNANGNYEVTLSVPGLPSGAVEVSVLHYSTVRSTWEVIDPSNIDLANKLVTAEFQDLSPVAIIAKVSGTAINTDSAATDVDATSPKTGVESTWAIWMSAAVVLCGAAVVVFKRTRA